MLHPHYRWNTLKPDETQASGLAGQLGIGPILASLLVNRGYGDPLSASAFLHPEEEVLHDPFALHGMDKAVERIRSALHNQERILVYGDYDADGVSSTALMIRLMDRLRANYEWYIPHRSKEGYGLHDHVLKAAAERNVKLVVTVDTGISAVGQIKYAADLGIDVVVTDHHEAPAILPEAYTLVNPKLPFCTYPFKGLAGVGVAYKLACALLDDVPEEWLQLVAIGTVADLMPLSGENRCLVAAGLKSMADNPLTGVRSLLQIAGSKAVNSTTIGFSLAPRINASGRLAHAETALELLITQDPDIGEQSAERLDLLNRERQQTVDEMVKEAEQLLEEKMENGSVPPVIVLAKEGWNVGVVGIVASKILDKYYRPVIILGINNETGLCKGSARSIPGFDIYEALTSCADCLDHFGGHPSAAGMSLSSTQLEGFEQRLISIAGELLTEEQFVPAITADLESSLEQLTLDTIEQLSRLEPFGMDNGCPRFLIRDAVVTGCRQMGKDNRHLKITLKQNGAIADAVAFGKGPLASLISVGAKLDIIAEANINEWNGTRRVQLMLLDARVAHLQIFDFRGVHQKWTKLAELCREWNELPMGFTGRTGIIGRREITKDSAPMQLRNLPVWVYDSNVGLKKADTEGPIDPLPEEITSLVVMELPETLGQLEEFKRFFSSVERIYLLHSIPDAKDRFIFLSREQFAKVYTMLKKAAIAAVPERELVPWLLRQTRLSEKMISLSLDVFEELNFISRVRGTVMVNPTPVKRQLESSRKFQELNSLAEMEHYLHDAEALELAEWLQTRNSSVS